jgi:phosphatidylcholine synthase
MGLVALPLVASAYGFCQTDAKTADHFFLGFPSYWNVVVFYLYVLGSSVWLNTTVIVIFSLSVFIPIRYLYPSRNLSLRGLTQGLGGLWGISILVIIYSLPETSMSLNLVLLVFPVYYLLLSFWLEARRHGYLF